MGADKGYCVREFIARCRARGIAPHVARIDGRHTPGLDARTTRHAGYAVSQRKREAGGRDLRLAQNLRRAAQDAFRGPGAGGAARDTRGDRLQPVADGTAGAAAAQMSDRERTRRLRSHRYQLYYRPN